MGGRVSGPPDGVRARPARLSGNARSIRPVDHAVMRRPRVAVKGSEGLMGVEVRDEGSPPPDRAGREPFSDQLERRLQVGDELTLGRLVDALDREGFALVLLILMFPSALPIPTGGVTHVLELVSVI